MVINNNRENISDEDDVEIVDSYDNTEELIKNFQFKIQHMCMRVLKQGYKIVY